jgi:hypothetical protein
VTTNENHTNGEDMSYLNELNWSGDSMYEQVKESINHGIIPYGVGAMLLATAIGEIARPEDRDDVKRMAKQAGLVESALNVLAKEIVRSRTLLTKYIHDRISEPQVKLANDAVVKIGSALLGGIRVIPPSLFPMALAIAQAEVKLTLRRGRFASDSDNGEPEIQAILKNEHGLDVGERPKNNSHMDIPNWRREAMRESDHPN